MDRTRLDTALGWARLQVAPDRRVACFEIDATRRDGAVALSGIVETEHARRVTIESVEAALGTTVDGADVTVLASNGRAVTVGDAEVPVRAAPQGDAERVTSAVYGMALSGFDVRSGWRRIRTPDGYLGWVRRDALRPARALEAGHVLRRDVDLERQPGWLPAGVRGRVADPDADDERTPVTLRTGETVRIPPDALAAVDGTVDPTRAVQAARRYLGTEYRWGGMTTDGIDCSGLVWMAYWQTGLRLPRDSDQQRRLGTEVERGALRPGDLLFFPGHVAMSLGGAAFVHASGEANGVTVGSLDPGDERYAPARATDFEVAKRLCR